MKKRLATLLFILILALLITACGAEEPPPPTEPEQVLPTELPTSEPTPVEEAAATPTEEAPPAEAEPAQPEYLSFLDPVALLTPTSGGGTRPILAWEPVPGADRYGVYLYAPSGRLYWSWQGRETSVPVGGLPQLREDAIGPSVVDGMTWTVIAYDADQFPLAAGGPRAIGP